MKKWDTPYPDTMKLGKLLIEQMVRKALKSYVFEAEEEKAEEPAKDDAAGEEENPFAGADDAGGEEDAADAEGGEEDTKAAKKEPSQPAGVPVKFNISAVKKYNDSEFLSDTGVVKSISKDGVVVTTQPDGVDVLVNFDDISESAKHFFKKKK